MKYVVVKKHVSNYPAPITLEQGERVQLGQPYTGPEEWPNWVFCYKLNSPQKGWVPKQILDKYEHYAVVKEKYTAKELTVQPGEEVEGMRELNGWIWCKRVRDNEAGWIPSSCLKIYQRAE
ncbi:Variant SH3 domain-containing protein [Caldalkalibacillus thermarum TA2.A1]|uniref:Ligand-binding protein SH3 n=1 Tax=Caldalkalibacillus thermarum (strain TA2.A1) TaxID=986075 RepID=F5L387_CALTT|nr:SH3 domain-containing protein [Caldalkalibacillus thermarum]EGL84204.1 Variant SH3 domain-containing protein [Caldalkalibacillus thermarum TA2.A1]QZT32503.1 ligand-binding protein SH3 [Caldalkalibacillus thermarum TA2.A1]